MKAIICGGRDFLDFEYAMRELDSVHRERKLTLVIQGEARGADYLARLWAESRGVDVVGHKAKWKEFGSRAGPVRNKHMLEFENPDIVIAMPGGSGTSHMKKIARDAGVEVVEICL